MIDRATLHDKITSAVERGDLFSSWGEEYLHREMDRFAEVAYLLRDCRKVLDVGAGDGVLVSFLSMLGHECHAVDAVGAAPLLEKYGIPFAQCNAEVDRLPFDDNTFDAVTCCQCLEHFTHSHLHAVEEMYRVLRPGGIAEIDVPNVAALRNRLRLLRGKNITWDYDEHYLREKPILYKGMSYYPNRHNREFTLAEAKFLLTAGGFKDVTANYMRSRRYRTGLSRVRDLGSMVRDSIPSFRKHIIAVGRK